MTNSHRTIDARLLCLTHAVVERIDRDVSVGERLAENVSRWSDRSLREEWEKRLLLPWTELRVLLVEESEEGAALRQNAPLGGILPPHERARIMREFADDSRAA